MSEVSTLSTARNLRRAAIVVALLVCCFAVGLSSLSWRAENAREVKALSALAELGAQSMDAYLLGLQAVLRLASDEVLDESGKVDLARANATLSRIKAARPELRVLTLALPDGTVVASTEGAPGKGATFSFTVAPEAGSVEQ